ncbi:hypothetical protein OS493_037772 [Desmophyllum pertusum]|uniref:Uncharacterized protein n=1 Tax=Desmophyllum pertusum TaxID=174260 RepID=A0A9W9YVM8_9CNID|nr:hypothetical protein OS493_037772 [Desmophyllum pertusum]
MQRPKTSKNALRLALNLHVLWHRFRQGLGPINWTNPNGSHREYDDMALTLHDTLLAFGGVAEACLQLKQGAAAIRMDVSKEDIKKKILCLPGPFCNAKRVLQQFFLEFETQPSNHGTMFRRIGQ